MDKKYKLPKEFATKWLEALRSGEYKQGQEVLCSFTKEEVTYCCLGVAGHICGLSNEDLLNRVVFDFELAKAKLPQQLIGESFHNDLVGILTNMNDIQNQSFSEIADWIEANCEFY